MVGTVNSGLWLALAGIGRILGMAKIMLPIGRLSFGRGSSILEPWSKLKLTMVKIFRTAVHRAFRTGIRNWILGGENRLPITRWPEVPAEILTFRFEGPAKI